MKSIAIIFNTVNEFYVYIHDKGEEFHLHYDFWPKVPFIYHFKVTDFYADLFVRKEDELRLHECCEEETISYYSKYAIKLKAFISIFWQKL